MIISKQKLQHTSYKLAHKTKNNTVAHFNAFINTMKIDRNQAYKKLNQYHILTTHDHNYQKFYQSNRELIEDTISDGIPKDIALSTLNHAETQLTETLNNLKRHNIETDDLLINFENGYRSPKIMTYHDVYEFLKQNI